VAGPRGPGFWSATTTSTTPAGCVAKALRKTLQRHVARQSGDLQRTEPVQRLNRPLPAHVAGQVGGAGPVGGGAGHAERGHCRDPASPAALMDELGGGLDRMQGIGVTSVPCKSIWPSTTLAIGTSFVLAPTSAWAAITGRWPSRGRTCNGTVFVR
jgi:hypothetical protein